MEREIQIIVKKVEDGKLDFVQATKQILQTIANNTQALQLQQPAVSSSVSLPKQRRVMFKFDDDEPMHLNSIFEGGEFIIKLKEGKIKFEKDGKSFELYVE